MAATIETGFPYYSLLFKKVREGGGAIPWGGLLNVMTLEVGAYSVEGSF